MLSAVKATAGRRRRAASTTSRRSTRAAAKATESAASAVAAPAAAETVVAERTRQVRQHEDTLHLVGLALQASETAIAIVDAQQSIVWLNPALERLCQRATGSGNNNNNNNQNEQDASLLSNFIHRSLDDVLALEEKDAQKLLNSFDPTTRHEVEISVGEAIINAEVSPFWGNHSGENNNNKHNHPSSDDSHDDGDPHNKETKLDAQPRYVVALKDISEFRKLQRVEKLAEQEAMLTKAMSDSMETLTHELRTPYVHLTTVPIHLSEGVVSKLILDPYTLFAPFCLKQASGHYGNLQVRFV